MILPSVLIVVGVGFVPGSGFTGSLPAQAVQLIPNKIKGAAKPK
jgi:hypothetical protein